MKLTSYRHTNTIAGLQTTEPARELAPAPGATGPAPETRSSATSGSRLSPLGATALVVGSIVGVGIFNLPSALAPYGPITLVSMGLTTIGALALGVAVRVVGPPDAGSRWAVCLCARGVRKRPGLRERLVLLDNRLGW